jgi:hypothetical protein
MSAARATLSKFRIGSAGLRSTGAGLNAGEVIAIILTAGLLIGAVTYYWTSLRPEEERLRVLERQYSDQQADIARSISLKQKPTTSPAEQAKLTLGTLSEFKEDHLTPFGSGRITLINELNALTRKHGLQLTSGIDMATEAEVDAGADGDPKDKAGKGIDLNKVFPSMFVRVTVFGGYKSLRGFLAELERNKQFLVIDSVGLVNQELKTPTGRGRGQVSESGSSGIALTVEVWAYFRPAERV